jgi:hypothetical protein
MLPTSVFNEELLLLNLTNLALGVAVAGFVAVLLGAIASELWETRQRPGFRIERRPHPAHGGWLRRHKHA